jgi:hypothetical protein
MCIFFSLCYNGLDPTTEEHTNTTWSTILTFSGQSTHICALKGKEEVAKVNIFVHWNVGKKCQSTHICALKGREEVAKVHTFVHWKVGKKWPKYTHLCTKVRLNWPKYTYLCSRAFKRHQWKRSKRNWQSSSEHLNRLRPARDTAVSKVLRLKVNLPGHDM